MNQFVRQAVILAVCLGTMACGGDESTPAPQPTAPAVPTLSASVDVNADAPALTKAQRAIALDFNALLIVGADPQNGNVQNPAFGPPQLVQNFDRVVLNLPYLALTSYDSANCAPMLQSGAANRSRDSFMNYSSYIKSLNASLHSTSKVAERATALIQEMRAEGITPAGFAVNVEFVKYSNLDGVSRPSGLIHGCEMGDGENLPAFFRHLDLRRDIVTSFQELAAGDGVTDITFGVALNQFFRPSFQQDRRPENDYANLVSLYHEVYAAIKAVNGDIAVGPGFNWDIFRTAAVESAYDDRLASAPSCAEGEGEACPSFLECQSGKCLRPQADDPRGLIDVRNAYEASVMPFLGRARQGDPIQYTATADYVGVQLIPFDPSGSPFLGQPNPEDADSRQQIADWYAPLEFFTEQIGGRTRPIVISQMDWPGQQYALKSDFLTSIKRALSPFEIKWAAWQRGVAVGTECVAGGNCACTEFENRGLDEKYCRAGMIPTNGQVNRTVSSDSVLYLNFVTE
ncbi:MAG: hypothetical protein VX589_20715 [Myxococcota bacterium]|nr:hypothetical protein [Myxococcota bacterium]